MIKLERPVRRRVPARRRDLVIGLSMEDGEPVIEVREVRQRTSYKITAEGLYTMLVERATRATKKRRINRPAEGK